jgi:CelD/BcsL family acetyltransferase involved in cellulose biosynthesis
LEFTVANEDNWSTIFDELEPLHTARWQNSGQPGLFADSRVCAWHREALPALLGSGTLRLFALSLNDEIIAALYALLDPPTRSDRTLYFYMTAYSIRHAKLRPGTVLMALAAEPAAQEGARMVDLLRGDEPYKQLWQAQRVPTFGFSMPCLKLSSSFSDVRDADQAAA